MRWPRRRPTQDFAEEIRAHIELEQARLEEQGMPHDQARAAARRAFGNVGAAQEQFHEKHRLLWAGHWLGDLRYALRTLRKSAWFTATAVTILAVALGANLAVFSWIDALILRSIPVSRPEELVSIDPIGPAGPLNGMPSLVLDPLSRDPAFRGVCGFITPRITTSINGAVGATGTLSMSGDCFGTLGISTQLGRPFTEADDRPEAPDVVVITAGLWRRAFAGSRDVLGKQLQAGSQVYTVIGVTADRFTGLIVGFEPGLITPLHHTPAEGPRRHFTWYWVTVFARRAPGISQAAATARIAAITPALLEQSMPLRYNQAERNNYLGNRLTVKSARTGVDWVLRARFGPALSALLGICTAILLIACLNLAGLLVARTLSRQKEIAVRLAIGASQWRVIRPLVLESLLLVAAGGLGAVLFASWASQSIAARAATLFGSFTMDASLTGRTAVWLALMMGSVAAILTLIPAWQARRSARLFHFQNAGRGIVGGAPRSQRLLIGLQVAFTLALVAAGGIFASSFRNLASLPLGLRTEGVAEAMLAPLPGASPANPNPFYATLLDRVATVPDVRAASLSTFALYWNRPVPQPIRSLEGSREVRAQTISVTDGYFGVIGAPLREGQDFSRDHPEPEAIVNQPVAQLLGGRVTGGYILIGETGATRRYRVIGVAPPMRISMSDPAPQMPPVVYLNLWQESASERWPVLFVQGKNGVAPDAKALASAVQTLGRTYVDDYQTLDAARWESILEDRLMAWLATALGLLALLLAATGLFAVLSRYVQQRTNEIGLRMALGAGTAHIHVLVLRQIGPVLAAGVAAGLALAWAAGRSLTSSTFGVRANDPLILCAAVLALVATALPAAWIPARRAAAIDPVEALRRE